MGALLDEDHAATAVATEKSWFLIDAEICAADKYGGGIERTLQRWDDSNNIALDGTLEDLCSPSGPTRSCTNGWDQFEVNREQFGIVSTFKADLSQYTTPLNLHSIPIEVKERAYRIAKEIENTSRSSRGERKWDSNDNDEVDAEGVDQDEEELWSAVPRTTAAPQQQPHACVPSPRRTRPHSRWRIKRTRAT